MCMALEQEGLNMDWKKIHLGGRGSKPIFTIITYVMRLAETKASTHKNP